MTYLLPKASAAENLAFILCVLILLLFVANLVRSRMRRRRWTTGSSPAHRREMEIRRQKNYEGLPPGQL